MGNGPNDFITSLVQMNEWFKLNLGQDEESSNRNDDSVFPVKTFGRKQPKVDSEE
jgi:hypothetical protein